ncbi:MAG: methylated-DNA--[protein]-cysteine S-methyltransferase [Oscillospiraceae bacterium]
MIYTNLLKSPVGPLTIREQNEKIIEIVFGNPQKCDTIVETKLFRETATQLTAYFEGKRTEFFLPLDLQGTEFQKKVWEALLKIPYGKTSSYIDIAVAVGNPKAARAVGMANHNNPISIIVPCHRVIGKSGKLVGYGGGLDIKKWLLAHEQQIV